MHCRHRLRIRESRDEILPAENVVFIFSCVSGVAIIDRPQTTSRKSRNGDGRMPAGTFCGEILLEIRTADGRMLAETFSGRILSSKNWTIGFNFDITVPDLRWPRPGHVGGRP